MVGNVNCSRCHRRTDIMERYITIAFFVFLLILLGIVLREAYIVWCNPIPTIDNGDPDEKKDIKIHQTRSIY